MSPIEITIKDDILSRTQQKALNPDQLARVAAAVDRVAANKFWSHRMASAGLDLPIFDKRRPLLNEALVLLSSVMADTTAIEMRSDPRLIDRAVLEALDPGRAAELDLQAATHTDSLGSALPGRQAVALAQPGLF